MSFIDLRSDTVTQPSQEMRAFMMNAEVGDDVYGEDPTVIRLQNLIPVLKEITPIKVETFFVFPETLRGNKIIKSLFNEIKAKA